MTSALVLSALLLTAKSTQAAEKLELKKGDRIIIIGNTLAERMQYFGNFETYLDGRLPELELVVHNLGWSADEIALRPRQAAFQDHGHELKDEKPDVVIAAFGFNESFAGPKGLDKFKADLDAFIKTATTTSYNGKNPPKLVLLSPIAQEDLRDPHITDGKKNNVNIKLYADAMAEAAKKANVTFVDLFTFTRGLYEDADERPLTINGIHLNDYGDKIVGEKICEAIPGQPCRARPRSSRRSTR